MRKILLFISLLITVTLSAQDIGGDYYVSPAGSDDNPGTYAEPWGTFNKAGATAVAGDTVYLMGGTYMSLTAAAIANSGTYSNPIKFWGYPGDTVIFDCSLHCDQEPPVWGYIYNGFIAATEKEYIHFKDFEIRNVFLCDSNRVNGAISTISCANLTFENITIHQIGQRGYWMQSGAWNPADTVDYPGLIVDNVLAPFNTDTTRFINCDVYELCDTLVTNPGNAADGWKLHTYAGNYYSWEGCRAWNYSDDGIDVSGQGVKVINNCWVMPSPKYLPFGSENNGFKIGANHYRYIDGDTTINFVRITNSLAMFGRGSGFYDLDYVDYQNNNPLYYNNTAFRFGYGFRSSSDRAETGIWKNNISYGSNIVGATEELMDVFLSTADGMYLESNNTWDAKIGYPYFDVTDSVTVTHDDFVGLGGDVVTDSLYLVSKFIAPRNATTHALPAFPLKLLLGSDLINAGTNVGLAYQGVAPDIGAYEYTTPSALSRRFGASGGKFAVIGNTFAVLDTTTTVIDPTPDPPPAVGSQIIADHTVVTLYNTIPQNWIDSVKTMWMVIPGESHSAGYRTGLLRLEEIDAKFAVSVIDAGDPEAYTTANLRTSRGTWGDVDNATGWIYSYGEEDWYTTSTAIARTKAGFTYANENNLTIGAIGFGHCYEDGGGDYVTATQQYIDYCTANNIPTTVFFTTGPVDAYLASNDLTSYNNYLRFEAIRDSCNADTTRILFDYADILYYNNDGSQNLQTYDSNIFPVGTTENTGTNEGGHITAIGQIRLAKAMWWMLARIAGWDGN